MKITRIGLDIAKNTFFVCGVDERGQAAVQRKLKRGEVLTFFAQVPRCLIGLEAGSGAHYWARELVSLGHDPRIIDPRFVMPYRHSGQSGKNDRNDAQAICEAVGRPTMRFVPIKTPQQQAILTVHRIRSGYVTEHTRVVNQLRGLLAEFGVVVPKGVATLKRRWLQIRTQHAEQIPVLALEELDGLYHRLLDLHQTILAYDRKIKALVRDDERAARLTEVQGIGPITASALVATIGNGHDFKNGRQFAAWLGLTPRQYSTGGKIRLGRISKRGDPYLRTLLIHGARTWLMYTPNQPDRKSQWAERLKHDKPWNKVAVALANKHARTAWAMLAKNQSYQPA